MNLNSLVFNYFEDCKRDFDKTILVRSDGIVVFASEDIKRESASIGALVSGVWQASEALNKQVSPNKRIEDYRFSFDQSDSGLYILPITISDKIYYMSTLYNETFNPALLKRNFRVLKQELEKYINKNFIESQRVENVVDKTLNREDYLFQNITDEEMDKLFALSR